MVVVLARYGCFEEETAYVGSNATNEKQGRVRKTGLNDSSKSSTNDERRRRRRGRKRTERTEEDGTERGNGTTKNEEEEFMKWVLCHVVLATYLLCTFCRGLASARGR